jgi:hypothetical protein
MDARLVVSSSFRLIDRRQRGRQDRGDLSGSACGMSYGAAALRTLAAAIVILCCVTASAATHKTANFVVTAPSDEIARQVGEAAEYYRCELSKVWLGEELPNWYRPCPIKVKVGQIGAGGATTFTFEGGEVFGWNMNVQGSLERILDSVIPHEVSHTIFASHFRRPLPRWADEGAATLVEHESERLRQTKLLGQVIRTSRRIPLQELLTITEYPEDMQKVLTLYAEGYSLADFLVQQRGDEGRGVYLEFLNDAHEHDWTHAFQKHYGFKSVSEVEKKWNSWVLAGSPSLQQAEGTMLADNSQNSRPDAAPPTSHHNSRTLRTRPRGRNLSAPEPSVTAMPQREPAVSEMTADLTQLHGQSDWTSSAAEYEPLPPNRTRSADQGHNASAESSVDQEAAVPRPRSDFPQQRERAATTRSDTRLDGAFSP